MGDLSVEELQKFSMLIHTTAQEILNDGNVVPTAVKAEGKPKCEKLYLINQLQEDDQNTVHKNMDTRLTKQKFKTFVEQKIQTTK